MMTLPPPGLFLLGVASCGVELSSSMVGILGLVVLSGLDGGILILNMWVGGRSGVTVCGRLVVIKGCVVPDEDDEDVVAL